MKSGLRSTTNASDELFTRFVCTSDPHPRSCCDSPQWMDALEVDTVDTINGQLYQSMLLSRTAWNSCGIFRCFQSLSIFRHLDGLASWFHEFTSLIPIPSIHHCCKRATWRTPEAAPPCESPALPLPRPGQTVRKAMFTSIFLIELWSSYHNLSYIFTTIMTYHNFRLQLSTIAYNVP